MTTMNYHPAANAELHPPKTLHGRFNAAVADLGVVCTGSSDGCLYFERTPGAQLDRDALATQIIKRLTQNEDVAQWISRENITKIAIR
jgi:hypothetical protein